MMDGKNMTIRAITEYRIIVAFRETMDDKTKRARDDRSKRSLERSLSFGSEKTSAKEETVTAERVLLFKAKPSLEVKNPKTR